ncbi:MAG: M23 family metallopeptidase [Flavobacteriales bacterium]|nr:M23 family metallopeptidase [Flavobacteriales bacterium]
MPKKKEQASWFKNFLLDFQRKKRIVVLDQISFEEKRVYTVSKLSLLIYCSFIFIALLFLFYFIVSVTNLKTYIPGYPNPIEQQSAIDQQILIDMKLEEVLTQKGTEDQYLNNLKELLNGSIPTTAIDSFKKDFQKSEVVANDYVSESEKSLREKVQKREKYEVDVFQGGALSNEVLPEVLLYPPIKGEVTNKMNASIGHYGVDVIAPKNEAVMSILKGTVIYKSWSPDDGHVIHVQHKKNLLSVYKHNSEILKNTGETVEAGEPIAIVGNSGSLSKGLHLHFELWHNGFPIDPEKFINFK